MPSLVALVPMRHHSQRVPGKNYRLLAGKPLFHHILETLQAVPEIKQVVVDTDSDPVMDIDKNGSVQTSDALMAAKNSVLVKPHAACASEG